jgi:hypothetical protein
MLEICIIDFVPAVRAMQPRGMCRGGTLYSGNAPFSLFTKASFHRPVNSHHHQSDAQCRQPDVHGYSPAVMAQVA